MRVLALALSADGGGGVICLLLGVAFAVSTLSIIAHPSYGDDGLAPTLGAVARAFMLCSFRPVAAEAKDTRL
jgi:hypothetical protein